MICCSKLYFLFNNYNFQIKYQLLIKVSIPNSNLPVMFSAFTQSFNSLIQYYQKGRRILLMKYKLCQGNEELKEQTELTSHNIHLQYNKVRRKCLLNFCFPMWQYLYHPPLLLSFLPSLTSNRVSHNCCPIRCINSNEVIKQ